MSGDVEQMRELLPLMIFAGGNAGWMLGWAAA